MSARRRDHRPSSAIAPIDRLDRYFQRCQAIGALLAEADEAALPGNALETIGMMLVEMAEDAEADHGIMRAEAQKGGSHAD